MSEEAAFGDLRPCTWLEAFPWIKGAADVSDHPWWDELIGDAGVVLRQQRIAQIAELAMARLSQWTIGQILPGLSPETELLQLRLPVRARNALARYGCLKGADLFGVTLRAVMEWQQVGVGTVDAILQALADVSTSQATPRVNAFDYGAAPAVQPSSEARLPDWIASLLDDLGQVATWYATIGQPERPLLGAALAPGTPDEVVKARLRLDALCAGDVLPDDAAKADVAGRFEAALATLDPRAVQVLADRLFADDARTLDEIGRDHGVTRERIRQIEGKARGALLGLVGDGGQLAMVAEAARTLIGTIRPLDDLLALMPSLGKAVASVGQPAWRVLDRLEDAYEIEDGWCVVPTLTAARTITQTQLQERVDRYGVARIDNLSLVEISQLERRTVLTAAWLTHCGYVVDGDFVLTRTQSVQDYGAAVLSILGSPLSAQEIVDRFLTERSAASLRNAMSGDDRFERVDRDRWALREWGMEAYAGVRSLIRERVARSGGRAQLEDLVEYITGRYSVTASSVAAYASSPPFQCKGGVVTLASDDREVRKTPEQTRRLFRRPDAWAYRVRITADHLRGSGSAAPVAIASLLSLQFGDTRQLTSPLGPQTIAWTAIQPSFGTIRRFLLAGDIAVDTEAFLMIHNDGSFSFEPARDMTGNPLMDALSLIGAPVTDDRDEARSLLAAAVGLSAAAPVTSVIGTYRERGDSDIADLLTSVRESLEAGHPQPSPTHRAAVDDILDLL
ncbi:sigma factor-like helix-turn-helix DNA-binding protein [Modestobacter sp. I12A-02662]|uniref:sigma factor-like helix-turn-helix DNA-binding protein n=1 Tax=Modestobacter sp. I12A-02662 TaxID=1730496 RepID=UPI0034DFCE51